MIVHYVIREVNSHAARVSSYRLGKTLTGDHFDDRDQADAFACRCNLHCILPGIRYYVLSWDEQIALPPDVHIPGATNENARTENR